MRPRISISGSVRPSVSPSVRRSVTPVQKCVPGASNGQYWLLLELVRYGHMICKSGFPLLDGYGQLGIKRVRMVSLSWIGVGT